MEHFTTKTKVTFAIFLLFSLLSIQHYNHNNQEPTKNMSQPQQILDPYKQVHIISNNDGTITRLQEFFPTIPPSINDDTSPTLSKDVSTNTNKSTCVRVFLPRTTLKDSNSNSNSNTNLNKLPIVIFAHGGGFILYSAASPVFHNFCSELASQLGALVISVEYRLAPETRLPGAYDDVLDVLQWVKEGKDEWVKEHGNFSKCVLMGQSAGANIVYYAGLNAIDQVNDLKPLTIRALILVQPFFGGLNRTGSELNWANDPYLPLVVNDLMWELALPIGADRSNEYSDPITKGGSNKLGQVKELGLQMVIVGCTSDPLIDRQLEFVKLLKSNGLIVRSLFSEGGHHGVFASDPNKRSELFAVIEELLKKL